MKPYETDLSRIGALYRIPSAPGGRTLEICALGQQPVLGQGRTGEERATCFIALNAHEPGRTRTAMGQPLSYRPQSFDRVILHGVLDASLLAAARNGASFDPSGLLCQLVTLLSPGGVIAGCVNNASSLRWLARFGRADSVAAGLTIGSCEAMLRQAGLTDIRIHTVLPSASSPLKLIEVRKDVVDLALGREIEARRPELGIAGYWVRRLVLALRLYPRIEQSLCFWGYKPC